jgi:hypothetical protein
MRFFRAVSFRGCLLASGTLLTAASTFGYCFPPNISVSCEFQNSDAVFIGKVISSRSVMEGQFIDGWYYRLRVEQHFRGAKKQIIEVYTSNDSGRFPLENGKEYLLFAHVDEERLEISNCGNSALLVKVQDAVTELKHLKVTRNAEIEIHILFAGSQGSPIAVHFDIKGKKRSYFGMSDYNGLLRVRVPPGQYSVHPEQGLSWNLIPDERTIDNPNHFQAFRGKCTALQFLATIQSD